ncbi:hypothetical protein Mgra_00003234 [Meloidogyne graminicola]|uniref:Uncharacterized protein n=1 Tax=Meloidogyne graminicola TaxID=189291 RepID=A0A8S9ZVM2_9BILA|nr:hypothetical protein Mgra_00003234 [Meloidogyne graminicola]
MALNRWEMNNIFLALTIICLCASCITLIIIILIAKCQHIRYYRRRRSSTLLKGPGTKSTRSWKWRKEGPKDNQSIVFSTKTKAVTIESDGQFEWIDEKNSELVSPTIKVKTLLHTTNSQLNSLILNPHNN